MAIPYHTHTFEIPAATRQDIVAGVAVDKVVVPAVLGSAAIENVSAFATAGQGAKADKALSSERRIIAGNGLSGGGNLSEDRTISLSDEVIQAIDRAKEAASSRLLINTGPGLTGGGSLTRNMTIDLSQDTLLALVKADEAVPGERMIASGRGLTGGGTLDKDIVLALDGATLEALETARTAVQKTEIGALGFKDKVAVSDIAAAAKPTGKTFLRGDGVWAEPAGGAFPTGMIAAFATQSPPEGWLVCDGSTVLQSSYPALFDMIGGQYGGDRAPMEFRLPDLRGRNFRADNSGSEQINTVNTVNISREKHMDENMLPPDETRSDGDTLVYCIKT